FFSAYLALDSRIKCSPDMVPLAMIWAVTSGFHVKGFGAPDAKELSGPNPLDGQALVAEVEAADSDIQVARPESCSTWPIPDTYELTADAQRICVKATQMTLSYESGPMTLDQQQFQVQVNGAATVQISASARGGPRKVGHCSGASSGRTGLWEREYVGCSRNTALTGGPAKLSL